jgi:hypothetical protein
MILQSPDWGDAKKRFKRGSRRLPTGPRKSEPADIVPDDEIDPGDFFGPEEFGTRRPDPKSIRP